MDITSGLVTTEELAAELGVPDLRVVDGTYFLPAMQRDFAREYRAAHLPGAAPFDIDWIADPTATLPHMMPSADRFSALVGALGIGNDDRVVVYDAHGLLSAARVWWMFRCFGHDAVAVLDGGMPKWQREGRPLHAGAPSLAPRPFVATPRNDLVADLQRVMTASTQGTEVILDARAADRFTGAAEEVWPGRRLGHIPHALNLPFASLLSPDTGELRPLAELEERFAKAMVPAEGAVICSCGSGVTACIAALALHRLGRRSGVSVYDGSWAEWGLPGGPPVAVGPVDNETLEPRHI